MFELVLDKENIVCHSGGAIGSDTAWESIGLEFGVKTKAYSYKTKNHKSISKIEISEEDYLEGIEEIKKANKILCRTGIERYMNLLSRNWAQVKYSKQTIAIGNLVNTGEYDDRGYLNKSKYTIVSGGTGYAVAMSILNNKTIYVFDQLKNNWFKWSYLTNDFIKSDCPSIAYQDFAGIGTRDLKQNGLEAIKEVYEKTFQKIK